MTEIEDDVLGVDYAGPVGRMLRAGVSAYLPPRPVAAVAEGVRAHLEGTSAPALEAARAQTGLALPPAREGLALPVVEQRSP